MEYQGHFIEKVNDTSEIQVGDKLFHNSWMKPIVPYDSPWDHTVYTVHSVTDTHINSHDKYQFKPEGEYWWYREITQIQYVPSQQGDLESDI